MNTKERKRLRRVKAEYELKLCDVNLQRLTVLLKLKEVSGELKALRESNNKAIAWCETYRVPDRPATLRCAVQYIDEYSASLVRDPNVLAVRVAQQIMEDLFLRSRR